MNEKILETIMDYINNANDNSAIMINGDWGSGKTFFIDNVLCKKIDNAIYIPLYGCVNLEEVNRDIYYGVIKSKIPSWMREKKNKKKSKYKVVRGFKKILSIILWLFKIPFRIASYLIKRNTKKRLGVDGELFKKNDFVGIISQATDLDNYVLIFDDLERCSIDIDELFGFINNLVEHKKVKTIIVANEKEISNSAYDNNDELKTMSVLNEKVAFPKTKNEFDDFSSYFKNNSEEPQDVKLSKKDVKSRISYLYSNNDKYKKIKEKLISKTIDYEPDFSSVIEAYKKNYSDEVKKHLDTDLIISIMKKNQCKNLRTLKVALNYFEQIYTKTNKYIFEKYPNKSDNLFQIILINSLYVTIAQKNGRCIPELLNGTLYSNISIEQYSFISNNSFDAFSFVNDYISSSFFDEEQMIKTLNYYMELTPVDNLVNDPLNKLKYYWEVEAEELKEAVEKVKIKIMGDEYNYKLFPTILSKLSALISIEFETKEVEKTIDIMLKKIKGRELDYLDFDTLITDQKTKEIYETYASKFQDVIKVTNDSIYKSKIDIILDSNDWGSLLCDYVRECNEKSIIFNEQCFLAKFDIYKLIGNIKNGSNKNIHDFRLAISKVYRNGNISEFLSADIKNIKILIEALEEMKDKYDVIKNLAINYLLNDLKKKLSILEGK